MAPVITGVGVVAGGSANAVTPPFPASYTPTLNDISIVVAESTGGQNYASPLGWVHVTGSPVVQDTNTQLSVWWKRLAGGETAQSIGDSGDHNVGRMIVISGCKTSGNPWNAVAVTTEAALDTSATWPGVTTTVADCLILEIIATGRDLATTTNLGALTNATYTSIAEQMDNWVATGSGGGFGLVTAVKATAGATGSSTATMGSTDTKALMTLALEPAPAATFVRPKIFVSRQAVNRSTRW